MSGTIQTFSGRAILPISVSIALATFASSSGLAVYPGLSETYISTARPPAQLVHHRHGGRLRDLLDREAGRLELSRSPPLSDCGSR
jgi:hypothetical protein